MTAFTVEIPDNNTDEVLAQLKKFGVKIRQSNLPKLDKLTKEDYEKHFLHHAKVTRNKLQQKQAINKFI
jgi:hypothetical protein